MLGTLTPGGAAESMKDFGDKQIYPLSYVELILTDEPCVNCRVELQSYINCLIPV